MNDPTAETTLAMADQLRQYAEHFAPRDWDYTRDIGDLVAIRHRVHPRDRLMRRIWRAAGHLLAFDRLKRRESWEKEMGPKGWRARRIWAGVALRIDPNLPDGVLDGGSIITHWEETGEYLQYVQPSVGSLLADFMEAEPDNPHALKIAGEMRRINKRYGDRLKAETP